MIYLDDSNIGELEKKSIMKTLNSGVVSTRGGGIYKFEEIMSEYLGVHSALATNSGTSALHLALLCCEISPLDEVILPALTFAASVNAVKYVGAKPVFVDIDPLTWNIDPAKVEKAINRRTKVIMPVHLYGNPCDMDTIMEMARGYDLWVVEDACESLGAKWRKDHLGTIGHFGCFSFNGNKIMTTASGGLIISKIESIIDRIRQIAQNRTHIEIGYNYRMNNIGAALGIAQFKRLGEFFSLKQIFNGIYRKELRDRVEFQEEYSNGCSSCWFTNIFKENMDSLSIQSRLRLKKYNIPTRRIFAPMGPLQNCPNAERVYNHGLSLPSSTMNTKENIYQVCEKLKEIL